MSANTASAQLLRVTQALQETLELSIDLNADAERLAELASQLETVNEQLSAHQGEKIMPYFNMEYGDQLREALPYGPATGRYNAYSPDMDVRNNGDRVVSDIRFGKRHEGPPNSVHGGITSLVFDQLLAFACLRNNTPGYTASLQVSYRKPLPLHKALRFETWLEDCGERKVIARGECRDGDELLATSEGLFIRII
ncbi:PaaI family thioesterase [Spongiibacter sp.]|uniref:PaaI family thioesterase n=1 Tax=Spongiibacter sp. TaxID=2024860 RepID=UPI003561880D